MNRLCWGLWTGCFALFVLLVSFTQDAEAIPAFARKYGISCNNCHVQFPKLNHYGIAFKNRGYRMKDEVGEYIWKSKTFPIAAIVRGGYTHKTVKDKATGEKTTDKSAFSFEEDDGYGLEFFSGGTLGPRISYFIDALVADNLPLVQFDDLLPDSVLNLKTGFFNVDNYFLSHPRRLTNSTYLVQTTADREDNVTFGNEGIELNGQFEDKGFRYVLGLGNKSQDDTSRFGNHFYGLVNQTFSGQTASLVFRHDKANVTECNEDEEECMVTNSGDTTTFGGVLDLQYEKFNVMTGVYHFDGVENEALSGTVEASYEMTPKTLGIFRYDWHDTADSPASESQYVASLQYHFVPNVKLNIEYVHADKTTGPGNEGTKEDIFQTNLRFGW